MKSLPLLAWSFLLSTCQKCIFLINEIKQSQQAGKNVHQETTSLIISFFNHSPIPSHTSLHLGKHGREIHSSFVKSSVKLAEASRLNMVKLGPSSIISIWGPWPMFLIDSVYKVIAPPSDSSIHGGSFLTRIPNHHMDVGQGPNTNSCNKNTAGFGRYASSQLLFFRGASREKQILP